MRRTVAVSKDPSKSTILPSRTVQTWTSGTSYSVSPPFGRPIWRAGFFPIDLGDLATGRRVQQAGGGPLPGLNLVRLP